MLIGLPDNLFLFFFREDKNFNWIRIGIYKFYFDVPLFENKLVYF